MNLQNIPQALRWFAPIAERLSGLDDDAPRDLSQNELELLACHFNREARRSIEDWIARDEVPECGAFLLALVVLDENGLLKDTEPTQDFGYCYSRMFSPMWGDRRYALIDIGTEFLPRLLPEEKEELIETLASLLETEENEAVLIWIHWLLCTLGVDTKANVHAIQNTVDNARISKHDAYDVIESGCQALLSLPHVELVDYVLIEHIIFSAETDLYLAAVVLELWLNSPHISTQDKRRLIEKASKSRNRELREVAKESG